ncbi:XK-related protein 5 [Rhea pennata]|uniref:XK-related protein 5 n=1 Tax=Rhea pennata TaxID=8795 RepID=UPI002E262931
MRGAFPGLCLALLAAEGCARLCTIVHYLLSEQYVWFWLTVTCLVPGYAAQLLSTLWFKADGHQPCRSLIVLHVLQLGIWKRYWDVLQLATKAGGNGITRELLMQQGDASVLRLLEALLQSLPHLLLQAYVFVAVDWTGLFPGVSAGLSLLSLAWALVSYSRFACLLKPGHLYLPAVALLCLLLWRTGMLGTRVLALVLFARLYSFWVFAVAGVHWLVMSFWLVSQQTDIVTPSCRWRLFNCLLGAVYVFCYINVCPGPSKLRVAVFYVIMLVENTLLLLLATEFLQVELWNSLRLTGAVSSGFLIGTAALAVYYSLLHPKSTEIWQGFLDKSCSVAATSDDGAGSQAGQSLGISSWGAGESLVMERTEMASRNQNELSLLQSGGHIAEDDWTSHHHWLLVKLALKTGDMSKINATFGDGGVGEIYPEGLVLGKLSRIEPGANLILLPREMGPSGFERDLTDEKLLAAGNRRSSKQNPGAAGMSQEDHEPITQDALSVSNAARLGAWQEPGFHPAISFPNSLDPAEACESSSLYFSANTGGIASPGTESEMAVPRASLERDSEPQPSPSHLHGRGEDFPFGMANISPILGPNAHNHLQSSLSLCNGSEHGTVGASEEGSELVGALEGWHSRWGVPSSGMQIPAGRSKVKPPEEPRFTSTPKVDPKGPQQGPQGLAERTGPSGLLE